MVSGIGWKQKEFLRELPSLSLPVEGNLLFQLTRRPGISCCDEQKVDSFRCSLKFVLDFLASMFERGYQYSTLCNYRSAISAFHEGFNGVTVGDHPQVSALITGVFNERPPQPLFNLYGMFK